MTSATTIVPWSNTSATAEAFKGYADTVRPPEDLLPSVFAERYRVLNEQESPERPGPWSHEPFPFLEPITDGVAEAIKLGKQGYVLMKSAQGGGSQAMINAWAWLQSRFAATCGYMISKDELAEEFGRTRFSQAIATIPALARKFLAGRKGGESLTKKRFTDGMLAIFGGRSVLNLQSLPYRFFLIDEVDSLLDEIQGAGDPIELAFRRMDAFIGEKLLIAFAHPSTRDRGAAQLYYESSDQRRGFIACPHCSKEFWLQWDHVKPVAPEGMTQAQADLDARTYAYFCPECSVEISDAERALALQKVFYRSVLDPETAARKPFLGFHFSQLYYPHKSIRELADVWVKCLDSEPRRRVFYNKILGEPFEVTVRETRLEDWRRLIVTARALPDGAADLEAFHLGQVPPWVRFLTSGQDSRRKELHYAVCGWGFRQKADGQFARCGCLVDYGVTKRGDDRAPADMVLDASELRVFDQLIYQQPFFCTDGEKQFRVRQGGHDSGWQPDAVYAYCRTRRGIAVAVKGTGRDEDEDYESTAPQLRWQAPHKFGRGELQKEEGNHPLILNTYMLKIDFFNTAQRWVELPDRRDKVPCFALPADCGEDVIAHLMSERLQRERIRGRDRNVWKRKGENHWLDCIVYAFALSLNLEPYEPGLPFGRTRPRQGKKGPDSQIDASRPVRRHY